MIIGSAVRRRRRLSLTSLIDVIFLLLLFFMLSSTFTRFAEVQLSGGEAGSAASGQPDILIRLGDEGWTVNGRAFEAEAAVAELARLEEAGGETAVVMVRGEINAQDLVSAIEAIRRDTEIEITVAR